MGWDETSFDGMEGVQETQWGLPRGNRSPFGHTTRQDGAAGVEPQRYTQTEEVDLEETYLEDDDTTPSPTGQVGGPKT